MHLSKLLYEINWTGTKLERPKTDYRENICSLKYISMGAEADLEERLIKRYSKRLSFRDALL